jgi:hypothetical protein
MRPAWTAALVVFAAAAALVLADAVRDLAGEPSFAAVLRLVVEAVAAGVVSAALWSRSRAPGRPPGR